MNVIFMMILGKSVTKEVVQAILTPDTLRAVALIVALRPKVLGTKCARNNEFVFATRGNGHVFGDKAIRYVKELCKVPLPSSLTAGNLRKVMITTAAVSGMSKRERIL